jgi:hypothetical protein
MNKIELCKSIQNNVIKLTSNEILELFKIIIENKTNYTQNNNGVFLNLNWLEEDILLKLNNYISFCISSQNEITKYELMKDQLNDSISTKDKYNDNINAKPDLVNCNNTNISRQKFSSSMKFYLLKKKYMKQNIIPINVLENVLKYEDYIIN